MLCLFAAGPRAFTPSTSSRPGLETGDVVAFLAEVGLLVVQQTYSTCYHSHHHVVSD